MIRIVIPLLILAALVLVLVMLARAGRSGADAPGAGDPYVDPAHVDMVERVKSLAWEHRDLEPDLAGALIARIRAHQQLPAPDILDELLEIAWSHREASPHFSEIVISTIRDDTPPRLG